MKTGVSRAGWLSTRTQAKRALIFERATLFTLAAFWPWTLLPPSLARRQKGPKNSCGLGLGALEGSEKRVALSFGSFLCVCWRSPAELLLCETKQQEACCSERVLLLCSACLPIRASVSQEGKEVPCHFRGACDSLTPLWLTGVRKVCVCVCVAFGSLVCLQPVSFVARPPARSLARPECDPARSSASASASASSARTLTCSHHAFPSLRPLSLSFSSFLSSHHRDSTRLLDSLRLARLGRSILPWHLSSTLPREQASPFVHLTSLRCGTS